LTQTGQTTGSTNSQPTRGSRDVWSAFWETRVPVTGPTWNFPGAYSLDLGYAERYESYSDFGQTERPKFDVRWQPIDQSLTLRAAYIEAFHAPTLFELFSGTTQSFPAVKDTCACGTESQVSQSIFGNPNLQPEIAYEYTYGGVLTPGKWWAPLQGLTLSADFIHIDIRGFTTFLDPQALVDHASPQDANGTQHLGAATIFRDGLNGPITLLSTPYQNLGSEKLSAWDFEVVEIFETGRLGHGDWGTFTATWNETYMADVDIQLLPGGKRTTAVGKFGGGFQGTNGGGSFTHNRWYASLFYDGPSGSWLQGIDAGGVIHYIGQYWDNSADVPQIHGANGGDHTISQTRKVREWVTLDLIVNYTFNLPPPAAQSEVAGYAKNGGKNVTTSGKDKNVMPVSTAEYNPCGWRAWLNDTTLTVGVDNVFDYEPPFVAAAFENGFDESTTNPKGRVWYVAIKKRF
jgi:outer membrane receptor protein involved in Fe transport